MDAIVSLLLTNGSAGNWVGGFIALGSIILLIGVFLFAHTRPLTASELAELAQKRRSKNVRAYFAFSHQAVAPNLEFKKKMAPGGTFYNIRERLTLFPSLAAALLKYKKHEWMLVAMEKEKEISLLWVNKGSDGTRVCLSLPFERLVSIACGNGYSSVLVFHNHPNTNPNIYSCSRPSSTDLNSSGLRAGILNTRGLNLLEFVCERGRAYEYRYSPTEAFMPVAGFLAHLNSANGVSRWRNLRLHVERIFR
jgi:hypothetical protein